MGEKLETEDAESKAKFISVCPQERDPWSSSSSTSLILHVFERHFFRGGRGAFREHNASAVLTFVVCTRSLSVPLCNSRLLQTAWLQRQWRQRQSLIMGQQQRGGRGSSSLFLRENAEDESDWFIHDKAPVYVKLLRQQSE